MARPSARGLGMVLEEEQRMEEARLASLYRISQQPVESEQAFLDHALHEALALTGSRYGYIYRYDEGKRVFTLNSWSRDVMADCAVASPKTCYELDRTGIWGEAVRQRRPILINDFEAEHPLKKGYPEGHVALRRYLTVPVLRGESIIAVVGVANRESDYTGRDALQLRLLMDGVWKSLDRARAERALRDSEARLAESQRVARIGHYDYDVAGDRWTSSPMLDEIFGIGAADPRDMDGWLRIVQPDDREAMRAYLVEQVVGARVPFDREYRVQRAADGQVRWVHGLGRIECDEGGRVVRMFGTIQDITERRRADEQRRQLEQQVLHAQKLESLGVLAGGIAHDFNNILMSVLGNAGLARLRVAPESPVAENLRQIELAAGRAADLARQMLAYSGKGTFTAEATDLNRLVEEMEQMLRVSISKKAVLRLRPARPLPAVDVDRTQIRQVLMNLVINASEAIGERSGVIAVSTGCLRCNREYLRELRVDEELPEGLYVTLEVADTGCGMDRGTVARIFDPFFTTKFTGRGLGMAAVLGIVRGHRGAIKVYSEPAKGTTFKVFLPASASQPELLAAPQGEDGWRGRGLALLVDDEESVRAVGTEMLRELGFEVMIARDGCEALERYRERPADLVLLDLTMPQMDGEQAFRELRALDPQARVVVSSGYNEMEIAGRFSGRGLAGFVQKPYTLETLRNALRVALG
ncbi:MAG TPA: GAF domain-containing protein [bacterium]